MFKKYNISRILYYEKYNQCNEVANLELLDFEKKIYYHAPNDMLVLTSEQIEPTHPLFTQPNFPPILKIDKPTENRYEFMDWICILLYNGEKIAAINKNKGGSNFFNIVEISDNKEILIFEIKQIYLCDIKHKISL